MKNPTGTGTLNRPRDSENPPNGGGVHAEQVRYFMRSVSLGVKVDYGLSLKARGCGLMPLYDDG